MVSVRPSPGRMILLPSGGRNSVTVSLRCSALLPGGQVFGEAIPDFRNRPAAEGEPQGPIPVGALRETREPTAALPN